ncbi:possible transcriptional regulator [Alloactinosynnema sp. L-07]|uniref:helix-turn-helix transcriptional regulator n=1 Tax=Alloactinosynnema sp. L-07 TaxID=1653480 RepID=UPI00065EF882|nr:helix-turn-helix domain-containing protein [Alloactinosynnema sp. L-07]CRK62147.1 possible transcriptional regulator [Alloactinosynnema sp. L-07]
MDDAREDSVSAVAALEEPTRRRLYDHVVRQPNPVTRDDAATACGLPRATAAFHLDRLADEGLLDVVYERRSGRSGPGAGRPSKLYQRSGRQVAVSLPERQYEFASRLLAAAIEDVERTGDTPRAALDRHAREAGERLGEAARTAADLDQTEATMRALDDYGFEPRATDTGIVLGNCPFHTLARAHTEMVCGMNLGLLNGFLTGLSATGLRATLDPAPGFCCVRIEPAG